MEDKLFINGAVLRDRGIAQAVSHANKEYSWSDMAYDFLLSYLRNNTKFMAEDVRIASRGFVPEPPSKRAWGGIMVRAARERLIQRVGYQKVKNAKAHCTPAAVWESLYFDEEWK